MTQGAGALAGGVFLAGLALQGSAARTTAPATTRPTRAESVKVLEQAMAKLAPLHRKLGKPRPGEWLYRHREPGQTFRQYIRSRPVIPTEKRRTIYVQPLGTFAGPQRRIIDATAEFMRAWFDLPVKVREPLDLSIIPARARRVHPTWGDRQILTSYVLEKVLRPRLPEDAFALIAFTTSDLWPGRGWNFVFGQASLRGRVGVWSLYRFGDPSRSEADHRICLLRTVRTAVHEMGHMFSMLHCTAYACVMCGSNSLGESDRRPMPLCPECMAKVCWATRAEPVQRYRKLAALCRKHKLDEQAGRYERFLQALGAPEATAPAEHPDAGR